MQDNQIENPNYQPNQRQRDIIAGYEYRLQYEWQKRCMDLDKQSISDQQRIAVARQLQDLKIYYSTYAKMLTECVYCDAEGNIVVDLMN